MSRLTLWGCSVARRPRTRGWALAAVLVFTGLPSAASAGEMMDLQLELAELVERDDSASVSALRDRVSQGLPPAALTAMLDACREHPRAGLEPLVRDLAAHRTPAIRARALLAWAELGPAASVEAIEAAADDQDRGVRRLAVALGRLHPSDRAEAVVRRLLAADEALAQELRAQALEAPESSAEDAS